jgi:hypothetical protein
LLIINNILFATATLSYSSVRPRIIFIPGLGEETTIFSNLAAYIKGEKVFIDNWSLLSEVQAKGLNTSTYAQYLINKFSITNRDIIIGHSMGGWVALHIKQIVGGPIIQVSSFTDKRKIRIPPFPKLIMYWMAERGLIFTNLFLHLLILLHYRNKPSRKIFTEIFRNLQLSDKQIVSKQLRVVFNHDQPVTVTPDVRIHALADRIVRYPDERFVKVPGDHFALYTYAEEVYKPIEKFLKDKEE